MLILKQNAANTVPTPPAGKGTIFLDDSDTLSVKTSDGNVQTFPTVVASNAQVLFMNGTSLSGENAFTYDFNNNVLNVTGNVAATRVLTDNLLYANGTAWDLQQPGGSNTQIQFNDNDQFGGSAAFTFNKTSNTITASGNVGANNFNATTYVTAGNVYANSGIIGAQNLKGEGGNISNIQGANVSGAVGSATTAGTVTTAAQPNITSVGTLTSLDVSGTVTAANITANTGVFTGNGSGLSSLAGGNVSGQVGNALVAGTVYTNAQPNITSVGTLTSLAVTGNVTSGNVYANSGTIGASLLTGTLTTAAQPNVTSVGTLTSASVTGNVTAGNVYANSGIIGAQNLKGEGGNISNIQGANVSGTVSSATTAGTVTTAAQPNITSVGTLTSLGVSGTVTAANITANTGVFTGNANGLSSVQGANVVGTLNSTTLGNSTLYVGTTSIALNRGSASQSLTGITSIDGYASTVSTAAQPNITSVGTLTSLVVTGNANVGNINPTNLVATGTGSFGGNLNMNTKYINNLGTPSLSSDAATKQYVDDLASTALTYHSAVAAATTGTLATATGGTMTYTQPGGAGNGIGAYLSTTGTFNLIDTVNVQTAGTRILVKNEANAVWNGVYTYTNTTAITRSTDADEYGPNNAEQLSLNDYFFVSGGNVNIGSAYVVSAPSGTITFGTSNITFAQFSTSQVYSNGVGLNLSGTQFSLANTAVTAASYGNGDRVASFTVDAQGRLTAASNTVIAANAGNLIGTTLNSSVVTSSLTAVGTVTTGVWNNNIGSSATFAAGLSGANLASITGGNVTGTVGSATTAGTVTTAAQPNITSVGTLTSLSVTGNVTVGNVIGPHANGNSNVNIPTANGNVNISAVGNITLVVTGTGANISGTLNATGNANVGNIGTGTAIITTGNITTINSGLMQNGTSNVTIASGANVSIFTAGNATAQFVVTSTGANIAGTANVVGNANVGNIGAATAVFTTGNITTVNGNVANASSIIANAANGTVFANSHTASGAMSGNINVSTVTGNLGIRALASTYTDNVAAAGTVANAAVHALAAPTVAASNAITTTNLATFYIAGAPTAGTNVTITNGYALYVGGGNSNFVGNVTVANVIATSYHFRSVQTAISAAGTAQGNATALTKEVNVVSTVASGAGVVLPTAVAGMEIKIINTAANSLLVYPASTGIINSLAANAAFTLGATSGMITFTAVSGTQWYTGAATYS